MRGGVLVVVMLVAAGALKVSTQMPTPEPAANSTVGIPGTATIVPGSSVTFVSSSMASLTVTNALGPSGSVTASVSYDGRTVTIEAPETYLVQATPASPAMCASVNGVPSVMQCGIAVTQSGSRTLSFTATPDVCRGPTVCPFSVGYRPGWNLIGVSPGTAITSNVGNIYTLTAGDSAYETVSDAASLQPGIGYWVYFATPTKVEVGTYLSKDPNQLLSQPFSASLPAGQFVMIGNPFATRSEVSGADAVYLYDAESGQYVESSTLQPGQGAWAYSALGGTVTIAGQ